MKVVDEMGCKQKTNGLPIQMESEVEDNENRLRAKKIRPKKRSKNSKLGM